jgi:uncharacterized protein (DUF4415 family)
MPEKRGRIVRVTAEEARQMCDRTDYAALDAMTDEDVAKTVAEDPDAAPLDIDWTKARLVLPPGKESVTLRVDKDLMHWFRKGGKGYQTRINAVLRAYKDAHHETDRRTSMNADQVVEAIIEMVRDDRAHGVTPRTTDVMIPELRRQGFDVPSKPWVQGVRNTAIRYEK